MTQPSVSVIVVSRGRSQTLARCLLGLSQLQYEPFEIVVVADPAGIRIAETMPFATALKLHTYDVPNISAARNIGLRDAAGDIVAFIDDDAVPEPQWLRHLVAPTANSEVAAMGGFVRGRNGISFQWRARMIDALGEAHYLDVDPEVPCVLTPPPGRAVKTEGTNMAFRRAALIDLGGFDEAFHYFLDETDINVRLARAGHATAIVPLAEVHHGFAANSLRTQARVPRDLFDIGASWAVFHRKHVPETDRTAQWKRLRTAERQRLLRHMIQGGLEPRDVRRLMARLDAGHAEGLRRDITRVQLPKHATSGFKIFPFQPRKSVFRLARPWSLKSRLAEAAAEVKDGAIVTLLSLSPSAFYHQLDFTVEGFWLQRGGLFGRSLRNAPLFQFTTRARRAKKERSRITRQRGLN